MLASFPRTGAAADTFSDSELELLSAMLLLDKSALTVAWNTGHWGALPISRRGSGDEAKAGQILISQRAFGLIERSVDAAHIGALNLKGFNRPMSTFEVLAWRDELQCQGPVSAPLSAANDL